jgi:hypothetical protein
MGLEKPKDPQAFRSFKEKDEPYRARIATLRPSGPNSRQFLSKNATALVIGDSIFVHSGFERINEEVRDWINGSAQGHCKLYGQECCGVVKENFRRGGEELRLFSSRTHARHNFGGQRE